MENNNIIIRGYISEEFTKELTHKSSGESFFETKIECRRDSGTLDILPVVMSEVLCRELKVNDYVEVIGEVRTYNNQEGDRRRCILVVFALSVQPAEIKEYGDMNQVELHGFLCKKPVYRTTLLGREITDCLVAVNRAYGHSDYIPCITWGRNARRTAYFNIADEVHIKGRLQSRNYRKVYEDGREEIRTAYELSVSYIAKAEEEVDSGEVHQEES